MDIPANFKGCFDEQMRQWLPELIVKYSGLLQASGYWQPEIGHGESIYTTEISKQQKSELFFFFWRDCLPTHH